MLPLRRKSPSDEMDGDALSNEENMGTTTNYLSFQDNGGGINEDNEDTGGQRRWFGGRRANDQVHSHRGFTTSIHDMFQSHETERIDCCAMTCCGMMQSDRDRYFLQGITPPSLIRRLWLHVIFPCFLFSIAGYGCMNIPDYRVNNLFTTGTILLMLYYFILQCLKGRAKRIEIRKDLLWTKAQLLDRRRQNLSVILEQERPDDHGEDQEYYLGQKRGDFFAAHPCMCSCYSEDRLVQRDEDEDPAGASLCTSIWEWFCPPCCGMHLQCCGVCALAQEGREVETALLPRSYLRVDYITMQPYADFYPAIYQARHQGGTDDHDDLAEGASSDFFPGLSRLSKQLLQVLATLVVFLVIWIFTGRLFWKYVLTANIPEWRLFGWSDMVVFCVTWIQSVGLLTLFVWLANRPKASEVSLDALIKYFAAGFCLSTALAIFWEVVLGIILKILVSLFLAVAGVDITQRPQSQHTTFLHGFGSAVSNDANSNFLQTYGKEHPFFFTIYLLVASFLLAAFVEEMCKYYGYRMVEHPDFLSRRDMEDAMNVVHGEFEEDPDASRQERHDFSKQRRSFQSHGAAVTVAMVAVAMGFTCCENLVYVFIYSGSSLELELSVLLARSFFPVHALAAALQSLGVVERDVEGKRVSKLGRIIAPAVLFHGFYDFLILWIDFLADRRGIYAENDDENLFEWPVLFSFLSSVLVVAAGLWYFMQRARRQRNRLISMDQEESAVRSNLI